MSFFAELKRRNVIRVGIAYVVVAWLIMQFADVVLNNIAAPGWVFQVIMLVLAIGLPLVLVFAWAFEMTPEGLKKEKDVDRSQSITPVTGKKLNNTILVLMALAIAYLLFDKFSGPAQPGSEHFSQQTSGQSTEAGEKSSQVPNGAIAQAGNEAEPVNSHNSIAVLPFANRSRDEDDAFFSDGIHDDLLTQLAKINDLKVISRTSVMKYQDTRMTIPEIAAELGVSNILEGGIQRAGDRIRINAQLIAVDTDEHLWAETFDREMTIENIFDIQSEITRQIVMAVKGELSETEQQVLGAKPTTNLEAYEAYLHAKAAINRADYSLEKYIEAQPWAERAIKADPFFAEAWAILAEIHAQAVWIGYDNTPERHLAAREALDQAVKLNPESASVIAAQADYFYRFDNDYPAALATYKKATKIAPSDTRILFYMALTLRRLGEWVESINVFEKAFTLDPANVFIATQMIDTLGFMNEWDRIESLLSEWLIKYPDSNDLKANQIRVKLQYRGDLESARELFDLLKPWPGEKFVTTANTLFAFERDFDGWLVLQDTPEASLFGQFGSAGDMTKGIIYHLKGDEERARLSLQNQLDDLLAKQPTGTYIDAFNQSNVAVCWSYLGEHEKALRASQQAMEMMPREKDHIFGTLIARTHTQLLARAGKRDEALQRLAASVDKIEGLTRWQLYLDPQWDFFRDDERFNELARPLKLEESRQ